MKELTYGVKTPHEGRQGADRAGNGGRPPCGAKPLLLELVALDAHLVDVLPVEGESEVLHFAVSSTCLEVVPRFTGEGSPVDGRGSPPSGSERSKRYLSIQPAQVESSYFGPNVNELIIESNT